MSVQDSPPDPRVSEAALVSARDLLFLLATGGNEPSTWSDQTRAEAQLVLDAFEDALAEVANERARAAVRDGDVGALVVALNGRGA